MIIGTIKHKGLRRLVEAADSSGLPAAYVDKIEKMLTMLQAISGSDELRFLPSWRAHQLAGDRRGTWSLHVSANWRVTFGVSGEPPQIIDLDFEDYH